MHLMIELDGARIRRAGPQRANSGWLPIESGNVRDELRCPVRGCQIGVALRAGAIAGARQPHRALMLHVAAGARWRERLVGMMDGAIVARQARLIGRAILKAGLRDVAGVALLSEQSVRRGASGPAL